MKVVVTGGAGQLGTHVLRRLIDDRAVKEILSLDLRPPILVSRKLHAIQADVRDREIGRNFEGAEALIHLAFVVTKKMARDEMHAINVEGSKNVFAAALTHHIPTIVYASSIAAYGVLPGHPTPITEETPRRYQSDFPYSANKFEVEEHLDQLERDHPEVRIVRFRPSILIGRRMDNPLAKLFGSAVERGFIPETSGAPMPLVWDEDVADAIMLALKKEVRGAFNVSADEPATAQEIAQATGLKLLRVPTPVVTGLTRASPLLERLGVEAADPSWQRQAGVAMFPSSARAKAELGWKPRYPRAVDVMKQLVDVIPGQTDPRIRALFGLANMVSNRPYDEQQAQGVNARIHLCLTGKGGGDFGLNIKEARLKITSGVPRPPTSIATLPASLWLDMLRGKASYSTAQFTGKVRFEGDPIAAFVLGGMISRYRESAELEGIRGLAARALTRWINQGSTP